MPLVLTLTEGVLPPGQEKVAASRITEAFLRRHGLAGNRVMAPNVTAHVHILPRGSTFAGGEPVEGAWLETKTPAFALADRDVQLAFFEDATTILHDLSGGRLPRARVWTDGVHAVDGTWNLDGVARTNAELGAAIAGA